MKYRKKLIEKLWRGTGLQKVKEKRWKNKKVKKIIRNEEVKKYRKDLKLMWSTEEMFLKNKRI